MTLSKLREVQAGLLSAATELSQKLSSSSGRPDAKNVIYALERTPCDAEALWLLKNRNVAQKTRIDSYWLKKHEYVKRKLVEKLLNKLQEAQIPAEVTMENQGFTVRKDILVTIKERDGMTKTRLALEIKTGLEINIQQMERLMCESDIIVLVRAQTGHVAVLRSNRYTEFLIESLSEKTRRIKRLMQDDSCNVLGGHCYECGNESCTHARTRRIGRLIALHDEDFQNDLDHFLRTIPITMKKAADCVIQELKSVTLARRNES